MVNSHTFFVELFVSRHILIKMYLKMYRRSENKELAAESSPQSLFIKFQDRSFTGKPLYHLNVKSLNRVTYN